MIKQARSDLVQFVAQESFLCYKLRLSRCVIDGNQLWLVVAQRNP